jgi:hypothetical protein
VQLRVYILQQLGVSYADVRLLWNFLEYYTTNPEVEKHEVASEGN